MWSARRPRLSKPGLFITATDTGVGKTVVTCAIAHALRQHGHRVGVCKPFASGCLGQGEDLISQDTQALIHFAQCPQPPDVVNPIRYAAPLAPAVAAEELGDPPGYERLERSLELIDTASDVLLVEGVGGLLVPLDRNRTVQDLATAMGYPVIVVTRAGLGTLNHTAMTVRLLRQARCHIAGLIVNGTPADATVAGDPSIAHNPSWLERMNQVRVLATVPACDPERVVPHCGRIPNVILRAVESVHWPSVLAPPRVPASGR